MEERPETCLALSQPRTNVPEKLFDTLDFLDHLQAAQSWVERRNSLQSATTELLDHAESEKPHTDTGKEHYKHSSGQLDYNHH